MKLRLWARLGLRARVTVMFGLGALLLSTTMGGLSFFTTRHFLVSERETSSLHQAYVNAALIRNTLASGSTRIEQALVNADSGTAGSHSFLFLGGKWFARSIEVSHEDLPPGFRSVVLSGTPATQTYFFGNTPEIVIGIPIPSEQADYFEVFNVGDLGGTLRVLTFTLFVAAFVTTVLGAAVGRSASGRSLRPLASVSGAAVAIASGRLDTRLPAASGDPELAGLTTSFNRMVDQLQERIEREARFTSDVSHELRSPLMTLSASLTVLESRLDELSDPARQAVEFLSADLHRFERMVGDLLEISRSDTGSADVSLEEVTVGELVRKAVTSSARLLPEHQDPPPVDITAAADRTWIAVDKRRFERIMANLLENAAHHGGGATRVHVELGLVRDDGSRTVRISVEDRGPGLMPAERARVFERFYRGQAAGRRGAGTGSGLGLALVTEHARLNGGSVWAEEHRGGGARFVVELPAIDDVVSS